MPLTKEETYRKTERPKNSVPPGQRGMEDYKKDAKVYKVDALITNRVSFQVKSNSEHFLWQWLMKQLKPVTQTQPQGSSIQIEIKGTTDSDELDAEVYGQAQEEIDDFSDAPTPQYEVFEQIKDIFGEEPRD